MLANEKLYIIVRADLSAGSKLAQSVHCAFQFALEHSNVTNNWMTNSNYICILSAKDEEEIIQLLDKAKENNINHSVFREEDLNNSITAIALEPGSNSKRLCRKLKLA